MHAGFEVERSESNGKGVLQRFSVPLGCSGRLLRLEGTVHSDFEAWTSLKNQEGSSGGRKGWSGSEGGEVKWRSEGKCKVLIPAPGHAFFPRCIRMQRPCVFHTEQWGFLRKLRRNLHLPMTVRLWFTLSLITGSNLDNSLVQCYHFPGLHGNTTLCVELFQSGLTPPTHRRESLDRKTCWNSHFFDTNVSCAINMFSFDIRVVKASS